jgi:DNA-binding NarL/FixJ family response regulator
MTWTVGIAVPHRATQEALARLLGDSPDLEVVELGREDARVVALELLRPGAANRRAGVTVAVGIDDHPGLRRLAQESGADDYLPLDVAVDELVPLLVAHLREGDVHRVV